MMPASISQQLDLLGWHWADGAFSFKEYVDDLACLMKRHFDCSAVALWRIHGAQGERTMLCLGQYRACGDWLPGGEDLSEARLGSYFATLDDRGVFACVDTQGVRGFYAADDPFRWPDSPRAFLDAVVSINGQPVGVLSCYQETGPRHWSVDEVAKLRQFGVRVALHVSRFAQTCSTLIA